MYIIYKICTLNVLNCVHFLKNLYVKYTLLGTVGSQIVVHPLTETGNGPNRPNTIDL